MLAFDPTSKRLYIASEVGEVTAVVEHGGAVKLLGRDVLAAHARSVAVDPTTHLVYFPLERGANGRPVLRIMIRDNASPARSDRRAPSAEGVRGPADAWARAARSPGFELAA